MSNQLKALTAVPAALLIAMLGAASAFATAPAATIEPASEIGVTSAKVEGTVDPADKETTYRFEYVSQGQFESSEWTEAASVGESSLAAGAGVTPVEATLEGLSAATTYHLRLVASNEDGGSEAVAATFETDAATAPSVVAGPAAEVAYTKAKAEGTIDPEGGNVNPVGGPIPILWQLQYALASEPENWQFGGAGVIEGAEAEGSSPIAVSANLQGLQPASEYVFRVIANYAGSLEAISAEPHPTFTTEAVDPPLVSIDPITTFTGTTAHFTGTIDPDAPAGNDPGFDVDWHFECTPACPSLEGGTVTAEEGETEVEEDAGGLEPNTAYEVTLVAENAGESASDGPEAFTTESVPPLVHPIYAGSIDTNSAVLGSELNPRNAAITYQFEWGLDTTYGHVAPADPQPLEPEDNAFHQVTAPVTGLSAGTTYHFRVLATNTGTLATTVGGDQTFSTFSPVEPTPPCVNAPIRTVAATRLPDCRAYEMVSPPDKGIADIGEQVRSIIAADGGRIVFKADGSFAGSDGPLGNNYLSSRNDEGWITRAIDPPLRGREAVSFLAFTPDLAAGIFRSAIDRSELIPDDIAGIGDLYMRDILAPSDAPAAYSVITEGPGEQTDETELPALSWASPDLRHLLFSGRKIDPSDPDQAVYYADTVTGSVSLISEIPDESTAEPDDEVVAFAALPGAGLGGSGGATNAVSDDGSTQFFTATNSFLGGLGQAGPLRGVQLYARIDHGQPDARSIRLSAPEPGVVDPGGQRAAWFRYATPGGSRAFFTSCERLTADSSARPPRPDYLAGSSAACDPEGRFVGAGPDGSSSDLYVFDLSANEGEGDLRDLTAADPNGADVLGVAGASDDGATVYFVAGGVLASGALQGRPNLYVWQEGQGVVFIATLDPGDRNAWANLSDQARASRVTPDGHFLLFASRAPLTAAGEIDGHSQIYLFDVETEELGCVSCVDAGSPSGSARIGRPDVEASPYTQRLETRNLLPDGSRVYFETTTALLPRDDNGTLDVYEFDRLSGRVALISTGHDAGPSRLVGISGTGDDAFFTTRDQLVGWDNDGVGDVYDARVDGGFPEPPPEPKPCGETEACRGSGLPGPFPRTPGSATVDHAGNVSARVKCKKGARRGAVKSSSKKCRKARKRHQKPRKRNSTGRGREATK